MFRRRSRPRPEVVRAEDEWRAHLAPEAYRVLRRSGTEAPGTSPYEHPPANRAGVYRCLGCGAELFRPADQFDSGTGWPSFTTTADPDAVGVRTDFSMLVPRREATCTRCGGHLGHVFADGPAPTGQRWCINGAALTLDRSGSPPAAGLPDESTNDGLPCEPASMDVADLAGPWDLLDPTSARALETELGSEVTPGHELHGLALRAVARCGGCDDAVFQASDGTFALVHLTWSGGPEIDPWPRTTRLGGFVTVETAMDQHEH